MYFSTDFTDALKGDCNVGVFMRLDTSPVPLRLCVGVNDVPIGISSKDADGTVYRGAGALVAIPQLEILINGLADSVDIGLSGVRSEHLALISEGAPPILGAELSIGLASLDENYQPTSTIQEVWSGYGDVLSYGSTSDKDGGKIFDITLTALAGNPTRSKQRLATYSPQDQRAQNPISGDPDDAFCNRVPRYFPGYFVAWPRF